jgi:hypothetical protein
LSIGYSAGISDCIRSFNMWQTLSVTRMGNTVAVAAVAPEAAGGAALASAVAALDIIHPVGGKSRHYPANP